MNKINDPKQFFGLYIIEQTINLIFFNELEKWTFLF